MRSLPPSRPQTPPTPPASPDPAAGRRSGDWHRRLDAWLAHQISAARPTADATLANCDDATLAACFGALDDATWRVPSLARVLGTPPWAAAAQPLGHPPAYQVWPRADVVDLTALGGGSYLVGPNPAAPGPFFAALWAGHVDVVVALAEPRWLGAADDDVAAERVGLQLVGPPFDLTANPAAGWRVPCALVRGSESRPLTLVRCAWPDFAAPPSRALARTVALAADARSPGALGAWGEPAPVAVHCGAGLGRSGTFVLASALVRATPRGRAPSLRGALRMFVALRLQRSGAVETTAQFVAALHAAQLAVARTG